MRLELSRQAVENVILLNVRLNNRTLVRMILDTGAKYTVITPDVARRVGIDLQANIGRVHVVTATRVDQIPLITVDNIDVHGLVIPSVPAVVSSLPAALGAEGLLGMSFLKHCRMILDAPNRVLELDQASA